MTIIASTETRIVDAMRADDWATVDALAAELDRLHTLQPVQPAPQPANTALWYAQHQIPVFPCWPGGTRDHTGKPRDKQPMTRSGFKQATTSADQIRDWWTRCPQANVALATGHRMDVVDLDGPEAIHAWGQLVDAPPVLAVVKTPRPGGWHLWVPVSGRGNRANMLTHVDYRGRGGYVLAPPSRVEEATYQGRYRFTSPPLFLQQREVAA
ncbi:bifunctional DNA primase/polymerase [Naumannella sp. ID2617S]|nr:bifunctional DNA primase/polymerase [Naumannella sp. ID2617S]